MKKQIITAALAAVMGLSGIAGVAGGITQSISVSAATSTIDLSKNSSEVKVTNPSNDPARWVPGAKTADPSKLKVTYNGKKLKWGMDYSIVGLKNKVGKQTIIIKGAGKYTGSIRKTVTVEKAKLSKYVNSQNTIRYTGVPTGNYSFARVWYGNDGFEKIYTKDEIPRAISTNATAPEIFVATGSVDTDDIIATRTYKAASNSNYEGTTTLTYLLGTTKKIKVELGSHKVGETINAVIDGKKVKLKYTETKNGIRIYEGIMANQKIGKYTYDADVEGELYKANKVYVTYVEKVKTGTFTGHTKKFTNLSAECPDLYRSGMNAVT